MRIIAPMIILIMMTSTLAGCTGGDPDGGGNDNIDMDVLNQLIDDNFQDFVNNTTITVENHYHNNTTTMNDNTDNSVSNINGSNIASTLKMFTVEWNPTEHIVYENIGTQVISLDGNLQQSNNNPNLLLMYIYNGYTVELKDMTCNEIYTFGAHYFDEDYWRTYLGENYGYNYIDNEIYNVADNINDDMYNLRNNNSVEEQCGYFNSYNQENTLVDIYSIDLVVGEAIEFVSTGRVSDIVLQCDDGFSTSITNNSGIYLGGQANCTVTAISDIQTDAGNWVTINTNSNQNNNSNSSDESNLWPDWYNGYYWSYFDISESNYYTSTPNNFAVYFNIVAVDVYQ